MKVKIDEIEFEVPAKLYAKISPIVGDIIFVNDTKLDETDEHYKYEVLNTKDNEEVFAYLYAIHCLSQTKDGDELSDEVKEILESLRDYNYNSYIDPDNEDKVIHELNKLPAPKEYQV